MSVRYKWPTTTRFIALLAVALVACGAPREQVAPRAQGGQQAPGTLDRLLAPVALYPDSLLAQMLMSSTEPAKVSELDGWLKKNQKLKGTSLQDAAVKAGFEPSFVALALFPQVVSRMAEQIAWTTLLGEAFAADRSAVFDAIQRLRHQAQKVGTLKSTPQQEVATKTTSGGQDVIVIQPANPQVVYVPQYNTEVIYTQPPATNTVIVEDNDNDAAVAVAAGLIGFTAGIAIGAAMDNNYYYGPYGWHGGGYMYNDAWDDYYDAREDAREDWMDHREDLVEERSDRLENQQEQRSDRLESTQDQRTERQQTRQEDRPESQAQRTQRSTQAQSTPTQSTPTQSRSTQAQSASTRSTATQTERSGRTGSAEARGYGDGSANQAVGQRSGGSDAFSGYSSGASQRSSSARGQKSRSSSSRGGGGRRR